MAHAFLLIGILGKAYQRDQMNRAQWRPRKWLSAVTPQWQIVAPNSRIVWKATHAAYRDRLPVDQDVDIGAHNHELRGLELPRHAPDSSQLCRVGYRQAVGLWQQINFIT